MSNKPPEQEPLRAKAEEQLVNSALTEMPPRSAEELLHELQVYQIELEMQNETLRQSQIILEESRDRYVDFYDFAPTGYLTLSREGLIIEINLTGAVLLGKARKKLANRRFAPFVAPEDSDRWHRHFTTVLQHDGKQSCELKIRYDDGSHLYAQLDSLRLEKEGKAPVVRITLTDITERKKVDEALRESEEKLRSFYELSPLGIALTDMQGRYIEFNEAFRAICGYPADELKRLDYWTLTPQEYADQEAEQLESLSRTGRYGPYLKEYRQKDGRRIPIQLNGILIRGKDGQQYIWSIVEDIAERKQLETKLMESEQRWKFALEGSGDGLWDWNPKTDEALFSRLWKEMIGYAEHEFPNTGSAWIEHLHPDDKGNVLSAVQEYLSGSQPAYFVEFRLRCKDGSWKWILARGMLLNRDVDGIPLRMIGTHTDITERKLADAALHESETHLRLLEQREIVQTSLDGFWVVRTEDARIIDTNDAFCDMVGYSREELLTMRVTDLEANESSAETAAHIEKIIKIGYDRFETHHRHKQGHLISLEVSCSHSELDGGIFFVFTRDITERKQAEKKLLESESRFRTLFESATDCILILDQDGRIVDINRTGYERLGYQEQEMLGRRIAEFDTPECAALVPTHMAKIAKEGMATFEAAHVRKDGTVMPIEVSSKIIHLEGEQRYLSVIRDITERRFMEQDLRLKEFVLDHARDAVYLINRDLRFVYVNEEACRALGYSRDELLGLSPSDIDPDTTSEDARHIWKQLLIRGYITFETRHQRRDGSQFPVEIQGASFDYQGQVMNMALARDISERKRTEQKVAELQYRNELILSAAGDGICGLDEKGRINFTNPAAAKMLGYRVGEMQGMSLSKLSRPDGAGCYTCPVENCIILIPSSKNNTPCRKGEDVFLRKDGSTFPVSYTRAPIADKTKCIGSVVMFRDISERKRTEQHVRELSMHLHTVREEEKASFAREIHDELGSTLSALKIEASRLNHGLSAAQKKMPLFARVESMVGLLDDAVAATRRIITDLRPAMLDDLGLVAALEWQAEQFHQRTGIECKVINVLNEPRKDGLDGVRSINLFRIFQEALTNVARHSGASRVDVVFQHGDKEVILLVSDNGRGLPEGHTIAPTSFGIRGMHERVAQLDGSIEFDSLPDSGLNVTVKLPLSARE